MGVEKELEKGNWRRCEVIGGQKQSKEGSLGSEMGSLGRGEINVERDQVSGGGISGVRDEVIGKEIGNFGEVCNSTWARSRRGTG